MKRDKVRRPEISNELENDIRRYLGSRMKSMKLTLPMIEALAVFLGKRKGRSLVISNPLDSKPALTIGEATIEWHDGKWEAYV